MYLPDLITLLRQTAKRCKASSGYYKILIPKRDMPKLLTDLEHTDKAANMYWQMREQL